MSLYKTSRCRFFNGQGIPVQPYCNKGDACRYLHPCDAKWASAEKSRKLYGFGPLSSSAPKASRMRTRSSDSSTPLSVRRSTPLVPQSHLFKLNDEDDYSDVKTRRSSYGYDIGESGERARESKRYEHSLEPDSRNLKTDRRFDSGSSSWSKPNSRWDSASTSKDFSSNEAKRIIPGDQGSKLDPVEHDRALTGINSRAREGTSRNVADSNKEVASASYDIADSSDTRIRAEKIVELFKSLANLSNEALKDAAAYNNEEKKLKTYTELSSTLAQISPSVAKAVTPTLANIIGNRAKCKERVDNDFQTLVDVWEEIFDVFIQGVAGAIDGRLQGALATLKKEGEYVARKVASRSGSLKRKAAISESLSSTGRSDSAKEPASTSSQGYDDQSRKRRRMVSGSLENHKDGVELTIEEAGTSAMTMFQDMKMKMDLQAQTLERLTQENHQLKASLGKQPDHVDPTGSSYSASSFFSCASNSEHEQSDDIQILQGPVTDGPSTSERVLSSQLYVAPDGL